MAIKWNIFFRKSHYWVAIVVAAPFLVVIGSGLLLQLKKELDWVQPPSKRGVGKEPTISFADMLEIVKTSKEAEKAEIHSWEDIDRLDVRPDRGMIKVRAKNGWEVQLDSNTGEVLQTAYRRSDLIEQIHDGSWFNEHAKLGLFLPCAFLVLFLWISGMYLFWLPIFVRRRKKKLASKVEVKPTEPE